MLICIIQRGANAGVQGCLSSVYDCCTLDSTSHRSQVSLVAFWHPASLFRSGIPVRFHPVPEQLHLWLRHLANPLPWSYKLTWVNRWCVTAQNSPPPTLTSLATCGMRKTKLWRQTCWVWMFSSRSDRGKKWRTAFTGVSKRRRTVMILWAPSALQAANGAESISMFSDSKSPPPPPSPQSKIKLTVPGRNPKRHDNRRVKFLCPDDVRLVKSEGTVSGGETWRGVDMFRLYW